MTKYIKFKHFSKGVPNTDRNSLAKYRSCMNCSTRAYWTAVSRSGPLVLDVQMCEECVLIAHEINERRKAS